MSDAESDEDLRRAIALSLMSPEPQNNVILIDDSDEQDDDDLDKPRSTRPNANQTPQPLPEKTRMTAIDLSTPVQLLSGTQREATPVAAGLLGLNRWEMETERLARAALRRKRDEDASMSSGPAQKRKASKSPPLLRRNAKTVLSGPLDPNSAFIEDGMPNHLQRGKKTSETRQTSLQEPSTSPADTSREIPYVTKPRQHLSIKAQAEALNLSGIQYPDGTVKKTWAFGYDRKGDDIKIEEVLQSSDLELAVLSSFQIDADWVMSKLDVKTKVVWVLQAKDEAQKQNWASGAPKHFRFCFPAMDGNINCMHSKLILLAHKTHLRVVIPSANLTPYDWGETGCLENGLRSSSRAKLMRCQGAGTICFQPKYWNSNTFPRALMRDCKSQRKGLLMHSKMIFVRSERANLRGHVAWAYVGSHNLSESAWYVDPIS
ncbi:hypothetical protein F5882DRAFT_348765 [Hyaloscypha sp. PMI_1271]|nr:hypothetical protein F5882DRAFT_348765 [Hyaloscypha sp. PMI_1271]